METKELARLLADVQQGSCSVEHALARLQLLRPDDLGFACLDHHRPLRTGVPEVVFGENKSAGQICEIFRSMMNRVGAVLATRVDAEKGAAVCRELPFVVYHAEARMLVARQAADQKTVPYFVAVVAAGTSDLPVAEEARITLESLGYRAVPVYDVGVAGIHRLYERLDVLAAAATLIVVAGMEGALPGVVAGLIDMPVIAVPTSIGYGTGLGGIAALLGMLNSCSPGMAVVNIDNGFGAACLASRIVRQLVRREE
ncbi:MAG: nickel pincer cofactor biosynthesis protein LarB [Thermodesulfobacteriota bacterium]